MRYTPIINYKKLAETYKVGDLFITLANKTTRACYNFKIYD